RADPPIVFSQRPMSYLSGPDSIVASTVTVKGVGSVGSQLDGPVTSCMLPTLTSLAVQGGLPPTSCVMQLLLLDWANAGVAAAISPPANSSAYRIRWLRMNPRRWLVELVDISFPPAKSGASALIVMVRPQPNYRRKPAEPEPNQLMRNSRHSVRRECDAVSTKNV